MLKKAKSQTLRRTEFPPGTYLLTEKGYFFVQSTTKRYRFSTRRVLDSWAPQRIVEASEAEPGVKKLKVAAKMRFRNGSLLYSQANGKMYLISENKRRHITNPDWLENLSLNRRDAVWVSDDEINLHEEGEPLA